LPQLPFGLAASTELSRFSAVRACRNSHSDLQPAPSFPASARFELAATPIRTCSQHRVFPHQRSTSLPQLPFGLAASTKFSRFSAVRACRNSHSGLQPAPSFLASARFELAAAPLQACSRY
jgi:hypothetical protein